MKAMNRRSIIRWCLTILVYLGFLNWHGAFEGPLTDDEIKYYTAFISDQNPEVDLFEIENALKNDPGGPIYMVNIMKYRKQPLKVKDTSFHKQSSEQLLKNYGNFVSRFLLRHGSYPVFYGKSAGQAASTWGMGTDTEWSNAAIVRYRSLRTLLKLATHPEFKKKHEFKFSALEKTIAYPMMAKLNLANLNLIVFLLLITFSLVIKEINKS